MQIYQKLHHISALYFYLIWKTKQNSKDKNNNSQIETIFINEFKSDIKAFKKFIKESLK